MYIAHVGGLNTYGIFCQSTLERSRNKIAAFIVLGPFGALLSSVTFYDILKSLFSKADNTKVALNIYNIT